jgi:hypothetical protein
MGFLEAIRGRTAVQAGATHFLTNDRTLKRFTLLQVYVVEDIRP